MKWEAFLIVLAYAYPFGFFVGTLAVRFVLHRVMNEEGRSKLGRKVFDINNEGFWVGACEHFITVSFVLAGEYSALGILAAAKGLVRMEAAKQLPSYYVLGTLVNLSSAIFFGLTARLVLYFAGVRFA